MKSSNRAAFRFALFVPVILVAVLFWFTAGRLEGVEAADQTNANQPILQDDYPADEQPTDVSEDSDYPGVPTDAPAASPTDTPAAPENPTATEMPTAEPGVEQTVEPSPTSGEGPTSLPTPSVGGTVTPAGELTPTVTPQVLTTRPVLARTPTGKSGSGGVDWGLFWIGFSIPVLFASGAVLYLLDRQPALFQRHRKQSS